MFSFVRQTIEQFQTTGAVLPSSPRLSRAICGPLREFISSGCPPLKILEAGPGTGPVSREILGLLRPEDEFWMAELNPAFVQVLQKKLQTDPLWKSKASQVRLYEGPVQDLAKPGAVPALFDVVICGLPFTNFPPALVREVFDCFCQIAKPGAPLTWFEYVAVRKLRMTLGGHGNRLRLREVNEAVNQYRRRSPCGGSKRVVLVNVPPAWVHRVQLSPVPESKDRVS